MSGGYRYQERVFERLTPALGRKVETSPGELDNVIDSMWRDSPDAILVVDGLFIEHRSTPLPEGVVVLLHTVPTRDEWCHKQTHAIATSSTTAEQVVSQCQSVQIVRPGLDASFDQPRIPRDPDEPPRIVCVGTISAGKAQSRLVRILGGIQQPWQLALIGDYTRDAAELLRVRSMGEGLPIALHGVVSAKEIAYRFARADLLVSLSQSESFGMAIAEAAASGTPVLAIETGEVETFVTHDKNGWLLPNDASDEQIHTELRQLLAAPAVLDDAKEARTRPPLATWDTVAKRFAAACIATEGGR